MDTRSETSDDRRRIQCDKISTGIDALLIVEASKCRMKKRFQRVTPSILTDLLDGKLHDDVYAAALLLAKLASHDSHEPIQLFESLAFLVLMKIVECRYFCASGVFLF